MKTTNIILAVIIAVAGIGLYLWQTRKRTKHVPLVPAAPPVTATRTDKPTGAGTKSYL